MRFSVASKTQPASSSSTASRSRTGLTGMHLALACAFTCLATTAGFWLGSRHEEKQVAIPTALAATAASSDTMSVATGQISDNAEGVFFLDHVTGDLRCLVYYPRQRTFGAQFGANISAQFGAGGKNAEFMMVTGRSASRVSSGNARPGGCLVYVTDATSGMFAAYTVPWDRSAESSGRQQSAPLIYAGGGPIRGFQVPKAGGGQNPAGAAPVNPNP